MRHRHNFQSSALSVTATACVVLLAFSSLGGAQAQRGRQFQLSDGVARRSVTIWSEGTRMAGDLYSPKEISEGDELPAIVMSHGWGGTKSGLARNADRFAADGFIVLAFDYRGWGQSASKMVLRGEAPTPDENGEATVRVRFIRTVVDPFDQVWDIRHAIDFIMGEPNVDTDRLGYWGSSYSGGHAVWVAANEERIACAVGQVAAADSLSLIRTAYKDEEIESTAHRLATQRARGEIDPVPQADAAPGLRGWPILDKVMRYNPVEQAGQINIPILIIDAENEELFDRHIAGELAIERALANGATAKYHVVDGITHYGIYSQEFEAASKLALDWFNEHLK